MMEKRVIVVLARAPSAQGKTRLTAHMDDARARDLRERLFLDTLDAAWATELPVMVCFTPDSAREEMQRLAPGAALMTQRGEDLGARMRNAMQDAFAAGAETVALIGSDLPALPAQHILDAFEMARSADVVFGPTQDGGFYLVAAYGAMPDIFSGIIWSAPGVLTDVVAAAHARDLVVGFAPEWWDIDRPADLRRVVTISSASAPDVSCGPAIARRVREFLERDS